MYGLLCKDFYIIFIIILCFICEVEIQSLRLSCYSGGGGVAYIVIVTNTASGGWL